MNKVILMGNLTRDPELQTTNNGKSLCKFSMAVNREYEEGGVDFLDCTAWNKNAENISKYFSKGKRILIEGRIKADSYEAQDGSKKKKWEIMVDKFHFASQGPGNYTESTPKQEPAQSQPKSSEPLDDSMPF